MKPRAEDGSNEHRDDDLGTALRQLEVPSHRAGFVEDLLDGLRVVSDVPRPDSVASEPARLDERRRRRGGPRAIVHRLAAVAAAAVLVLAVASNVLPLLESDGDEPGAGGQAQSPVELTPTLVRAAVAETWRTIDSVTGSIMVTDRDGRRDWTFAMTAQGDVHLVDETRGGQTTYDAADNVERSLQPSASMGDVDVLFASQRSGLAPAPPDPAPAGGVLQRHLGAAVRAIAGDVDASVEEVDFDGRPAWLLDTAVPVNLIVPDHSPERLRVTVDQATGFPVRVVATNSDGIVYQTRVSALEVDQPIDRQRFHLEFPADAEAHEVDHGFRDVALDEVSAEVGYEPVVPGRMPEGFELDVVRVGSEATPTGKEGTNPAVGEIVTMSYRRGLDQVVVTTRPVGDEPDAWTDPLSAGEGFVDAPERVTLDAGYLDGHVAELTVNLLTIPHLWALTDDVVVTIAGDLDAEQLVAIANTLEPRP